MDILFSGFIAYEDAVPVAYRYEFDSVPAIHRTRFLRRYDREAGRFRPVDDPDYNYVD
jgi:hypothetical protein